MIEQETFKGNPMRIFFGFMMTCMVFVGGPGAAQQTPNHVFQTTEAIRALLDNLNKANFSDTKYTPEPPASAMPRHVFHMALDVWRKTQLLRFMNGLPTDSADRAPTRAITPGDVNELVISIRAGLSEVYPAYGLTLDLAEPPLPTGKKPADVYANLLLISAGLDSLGIPSTVPNDVFQVADTVLQNTIALAAASGFADVSGDLQSVPNETGKSPKDAYLAALDLLAALDRLTQARPKLAIKGGVTVLTEKTGGAPTPADVIQVLKRAQADLDAMRLASGSESVSAVAPYVGGKTPSDVVYVIRQAEAVIGHVTSDKNS